MSSQHGPGSVNFTEFLVFAKRMNPTGQDREVALAYDDMVGGTWRVRNMAVLKVEDMIETYVACNEVHCNVVSRTAM